MGRQISFKMPGCWLVFEQREMEMLLKSRPDIWESAIRRGKPLSRIEKEQYRRCKV
jgi:hypothetical protein